MNKTSQKPLFFLFTCVKNGRKYIEKLFNSILSQTKINFVHYIYEDGSTDPIDDLVKTYRAKASKLNQPFEIIYEQNKINIGLNMATKHCIEKCNCPYFIWIDCDNWVDKDFFKNLERDVLKNKECGCFRTHTLYCKQNVFDYPKIKKYKISLKDGYCKWGFLTSYSWYYYSFFAVNSLLFKNICNNNLVNVKNFYNDQQVLAWCYLSNMKFKYVKKSIGYCLLREDSEFYVTDASNKISLTNYEKFEAFIGNKFDIDYESYKKCCNLYAQIHWALNNKKKKDAIKLFNERHSIVRNNKFIGYFSNPFRSELLLSIFVHFNGLYLFLKKL